MASRFVFSSGGKNKPREGFGLWLGLWEGLFTPCFASSLAESSQIDFRPPNDNAPANFDNSEATAGSIVEIPLR